MRLADMIPEGEVLISLEPEELGLRLLPVILFIQGFGHTSVEPFVSVVTQTGGYQSPPPEWSGTDLTEIKTAIREAWAWLEGVALLVPLPGQVGSSQNKILSRRARKLAADPNPVRSYGARRLPKESLHQTIRDDVWALYHRGEFELAITAAMKAVEVATRAAARYEKGEHGLERNPFRLHRSRQRRNSWRIRRV